MKTLDKIKLANEIINSTNHPYYSKARMIEFPISVATIMEHEDTEKYKEITSKYKKIPNNFYNNFP